MLSMLFREEVECDNVDAESSVRVVNNVGSARAAPPTAMEGAIGRSVR